MTNQHGPNSAVVFGSSAAIPKVDEGRGEGVSKNHQLRTGKRVTEE